MKNVYIKELIVLVRNKTIIGLKCWRLLIQWQISVVRNKTIIGLKFVIVKSLLNIVFKLEIRL